MDQTLINFPWDDDNDEGSLFNFPRDDDNDVETLFNFPWDDDDDEEIVEFVNRPREVRFIAARSNLFETLPESKFVRRFRLTKQTTLLLLHQIQDEIEHKTNSEWKEKVEVEDHADNDTITYKKLDVFYFRPELSGSGLTGEETIVVPHMFVLSLIGFVAREKPAMMNMISKAINGIFDNPTDLFLRIKPMDLMFRGFNINCDRTEFAPKAVCTALKKEASSNLVLEPNNQFRFSLFGVRNGSVDQHVVTVKRGMKNVMDVGQVVAVDGMPEMDTWTGHCNKYDGTDGTVFPPFLTEKDRLQSFSGDLCRSFKPWYQKKTSYRGIKTNRYIANIGDFAKDPELNCFCEAPDQCPPKGVMDLFKCLKAPLYVTLPHYLDCDPEVQKGVNGLHPDVDAHQIEIDFEPISGTPMTAKQRVQFSLRLLKTDKIDLCKDLPDSLAPVFWIEEGLSLNKTFVNMLKHQLFWPKRAVGILKWTLVICGTLGLFGAMVFHFKDQIMQFAVSPKTPEAKVRPEPPKDTAISVIGDAQGPVKVSM